MAKSDVLVRMKADTSNYDANIAKARRQLDQFKKDNLSLGGVLKQTQSSLLATAARFASVTAAVSALGTAFADNIATARNFEKSLSQLSSLTGMVGKDLEKLKDYAIELGSKTTLSASEVADAFKMIGSQQPQLLASGEALKAVTQQAITLAEAAGIDLATASQTLSTSINQMGGDSNNAARFVNVLAAASQKGAGDIAWLGEAITKAGTTAKAVGTSYEELVANLEQLAKAGFDASTAGTALRSIIMNLEKQSNNDFKPSVVGLTQAFDNLGKANLDIVGYQEIAGKMFASQAKALADAADEAREMTDAITDTNTAEEQARTNTDNLDGALKSLSSAWEGLNLHINSSNGLLRDAVDWLKDAVVWVDKAITGMDKYAKRKAEMNNESAGEGNTKIDRMITNLNGTSDKLKSSVYNQQLEQFNRYINKKEAELQQTRNIKDVWAWETLSKNSKIGQLTQDIGAAKQMRQEYMQRGEAIVKSVSSGAPVSTNEDTTTPTPTKGKGKGKGKGGKKGDSKIKLSDAQQAEVDITKAQKDYADAINDAKVKVEEGIMTEDDQDKAILSAKEQLSNAYLKAYNATGDSKYLEAQKEVAESMVFMKGVIEQSAQEQKQLEQQTSELNEQEKKISDATEELYQAMKDGDLKGFYAASKKLKSAGGEDVSYKGNVKATQENMSALTAHLREQMGKAEVGSADFSNLSAKLVDVNTLQSIINAQIKNGLSIDPETTKSLMSQIINGDNIDDSVWQGLQDKINEQLKAMGIEPVKIDFKTGNIAETGKQTEKSWKAAAGAMSQVGSTLQQIEDPAAKVAGIVAQAIANVALGYARALTMVEETGGPWGWIAFAATGMATMISTIASIHNATGYQYGGMVKGYAQGGAVGGVVQGTTYSGDQIPIMANAGEVVLTRAMAGNLASQLDGAGAFNNLELTTVIGAEDIKLVLNNRGRRTGKGEYVQSKFRRS